ncbi:MAG: hypothetical protein LBQ55_00600 [Treponema sp.]|jgi:hypothetical protein|nr:hypothetical protein [Treponema sp.]
MKPPDAASYAALTTALKKLPRKPAGDGPFRGRSAADLSAATALPLATVRELLPRAADEFHGRLEVTASGEILYSFPQGFTSRYRGFSAVAARVFDRAGRFLKSAGVLLFKVWIMVMLVGYFALFMLIALAAMVLSVAASSNSSGRSRRDSSGGLYLTSSIFNMIIRLWFYSELLGGGSRSRQRSRPASRPKKPLHRAIFSFVFGEGDPNRDWAGRRKKALIAFLRSHRGVISLPDFMSLSGLPPAEAEAELLACCGEFGGSPEASDEGTIVYRFDELLVTPDRGADWGETAGLPMKLLRKFSSNEKSMNVWFGIINTVNLLFGGYFFFNALGTGAVLSQEQFRQSSYLYGLTYYLSGQFVGNPLPLITVGLGLVPLAFSLFFWLIPALRALWERRENERIKLENLRKAGFSRIWSQPLAVESGDIQGPDPACRPAALAAAQDKIIKEMGAYSVPDVAVGETGNTVYTFRELEREKAALEKYRAGIKTEELGSTVFDTGA